MQETDKNIDLSIVTVTWNSQEDIASLLFSIFKKLNRDKLKTEVIIIDNRSYDLTLKVINSFIEQYDLDIKLIQNPENCGFTYACNQGIDASRGEFILLLNPDCEINDNSCEILIDTLKSDKNIGASAPQLINENQTIQKSCRKFPEYRDMFFEMLLLSSAFKKSKFFSRWKMEYFSHDEYTEAEQPMGAALMTRKNILEKIGKMDERFFMFFNDVDLCRRIIDAGYKIIFNPEAKILHKKGRSVYQKRAEMIKIWNKDCRNYFRKHNYKPVLYILLSAGLIITGFFRMIFAGLIHPAGK